MGFNADFDATFATNEFTEDATETLELTVQTAISFPFFDATNTAGVETVTIE